MPGAPQAEFLVLEGVHREPLVLQQFTNARIHMPAELGDRGLWRGVEYERHNPGHHARQRPGIRMHAPADREVQSHL
ncbi:Uncharacterised protein [Mycobacteroides abscessus subsp. abscessus]|nr:Uncharacterised protein [Mycobacteroides abscessus subsp. abscessus]